MSEVSKADALFAQASAFNKPSKRASLLSGGKKRSSLSAINKPQRENFLAEAQAIFDIPKLEESGKDGLLLLRIGVGITKKWRKRFFLLIGTDLYSFQSEDAEKESRSDDLKTCKVEEHGHKSNEFSFTLKLASGSSLELAAASNADKSEWIEAIQDAALSSGRTPSSHQRSSSDAGIDFQKKNPMQAPAVTVDEVENWMRVQMKFKAADIERYMATCNDTGYDTMDVINEMTVEELAQKLGMKEGHARRVVMERCLAPVMTGEGQAVLESAAGPNEKALLAVGENTNTFVAEMGLVDQFKSQPHLQRYTKMLKKKIPSGAVRQQMKIAGIDDLDIRRFFGESPVPDDWAPGADDAEASAAGAQTSAEGATPGNFETVTLKKTSGPVPNKAVSSQNAMFAELKRVARSDDMGLNKKSEIERAMEKSIKKRGSLDGADLGGKEKTEVQLELERRREKRGSLDGGAGSVSDSGSKSEIELAMEKSQKKRASLEGSPALDSEAAAQMDREISEIEQAMEKSQQKRASPPALVMQEAGQAGGAQSAISSSIHAQITGGKTELRKAKEGTAGGSRFDHLDKRTAPKAAPAAEPARGGRVHLRKTAARASLVCAADDSLLGTSHADRFEHLTQSSRRASQEGEEEKTEAQEKLARMKKKQSKRIMEETRLKLRSGNGSGGDTGEDEEAARKKALGVLLSSPASNEPAKQYAFAELKTYPPGVDRTRMQDFLLETEFDAVFGMEKAVFDKLAGWKQKKLKKEKGMM
jgi:hypothetical protein